MIISLTSTKRKLPIVFYTHIQTEEPIFTNLH